MELKGKIVVVTGGASGIGRAMCQAFHEAGAAKIIVADLDFTGASAVAELIGGRAVKCDVGQESQMQALIAMTESHHGSIDLFCSNAGVAVGFDQRIENAAAGPDDLWHKAWQINVMAHVYAARILIPLMKSRGGGYFLNTISAAGLLSQIESAVYSTTKHAAVGFAENLAIAHKDDGIKVSILCPQAVDTQMLRDLPTGPQSVDGVLSADDVAQIVIREIRHETFLILPHSEVRDYFCKKAQDHDRWINGMVRLKRRTFIAG